jgi:hypothetical protein
VHDVDPAIADDAPEGRPYARIEGAALLHLDVVDAEFGGAGADAEFRVGPIANVTDGDRDARTGPLRPEQDGLFRPAAGAAHAAKLEHVYLIAHHSLARSMVCAARRPTAVQSYSSWTSARARRARARASAGSRSTRVSALTNSGRSQIRRCS